MSQLCFTQMSIHRLSWFSGFVQIFFIAGNSCSAKITLLSNDILKIPTLFLSVLTLLSRPFSSADFKTLSQKRNGIVHLVQLGACGRGVCSGDRGGSHPCSMSSSLRTWFPEPINLTWAPLCTQYSKATQSSTFSSAQLSCLSSTHIEQLLILLGELEEAIWHRGATQHSPGRSSGCTRPPLQQGKHAQAMGYKAERWREAHLSFVWEKGPALALFVALLHGCWVHPINSTASSLTTEFAQTWTSL